MTAESDRDIAVAPACEHEYAARPGTRTPSRRVPTPSPPRRRVPRSLAGGMFEEDCEVWDSAGRLVAQTRRLARQPRRTS